MKKIISFHFEGFFLFSNFSLIFQMFQMLQIFHKKAKNKKLFSRDNYKTKVYFSIIGSFSLYRSLSFNLPAPKVLKHKYSFKHSSKTFYSRSHLRTRRFGSNTFSHHTQTNFMDETWMKQNHIAYIKIASKIDFLFKNTANSWLKFVYLRLDTISYILW